MIFIGIGYYATNPSTPHKSASYPIKIYALSMILTQIYESSVQGSDGVLTRGVLGNNIT